MQKNYEIDPWYMDYLSNKGLIFTTCILIVIAYQICRSQIGSSDTDENPSNLSEIEKLQQTLDSFNDNISNDDTLYGQDLSKSAQNQKLEEISQKLASFESQTQQMSDFANSLQSTIQTHDKNLKSKLKMNKSSGSKKNVRFADGF